MTELEKRQRLPIYRLTQDAPIYGLRKGETFAGEAVATYDGRLAGAYLHIQDAGGESPMYLREDEIERIGTFIVRRIHNNNPETII